MNEQKSASVDTAIKGCDAVIGETLKNLANAYYFRGSAKFGKSDFDGAIGDYGQALQLDPVGRRLSQQPRRCLRSQEGYRPRAGRLQPGHQDQPQFDLRLQQSRRSVFQRKGDFARAAADYGEVTRLQPNNIDAWSARCWVRAISPGQTQQALADCNAALKIKPDAADVLDTRGFVYLKLGQTDNAIKDYDAALKLDPKACRLALRTRPRQDPQGRPQRRHRRHSRGQGDQARHRRGVRALRSAPVTRALS